jgi:hypothetical protein
MAIFLLLAIISTKSAAKPLLERFSRPWSSRLTATDVDVLVSASRLTGVRTPWNAPTGVWKAAWKMQSLALPLLHATDRLDLGRSLADTNVIADVEPAFTGMDTSGVDSISGGVNPGDAGTAARQRLGHEAAGTANVEHVFAWPIDVPVEPSQSSWCEILER